LTGGDAAATLEGRITEPPEQGKNMTARPAGALAALVVALFLSVLAPVAQAQPRGLNGSNAPAATDTAPQKPPPRVVPAKFPPPTFREEQVASEISQSLAIQAVRDGKVDSVLKHWGHNWWTYYFRMKDGSLKLVNPASTDDIQKALDAAGVDLTVENADYFGDLEQGVALMSSVLFLFVVVFYGWSIASKFVNSPAKRVKRSRADEDRVTFDDVAGQDEAKRELREVVEFLRSPAEFSKLGARAPRGVLMDGDPGNGKTLLARAVAGEADVPFIHVAGSEILEMFAGLGARRIRKMFKEARKLGRKGCILFIDEIETIGGKRGMGNGGDVQSEREQILNQLLVELDGIVKRGNIIVVGATNRPDMLDSALVRPGRLDRRVNVSRPTMKGREEILRVHVRKVTLAPDVDLAEIARITPGFSGAELANLVNEAAIQAGRWKLVAVDDRCFQAARDKALMGEARSADFVSPEERRIAAIHEVGHALTAFRTPGADPVQKITVLPRGQALGMVVQMPEKDRLMLSKRKLESDLVVALGGRAAEEIEFGDDFVTTGAIADIRQATKVARDMGGRLGMFPELGCMDYLGDHDGQGGASQITLARLDELVAAKIEKARQQAMKIVKAEIDGVRALAEHLLKVETMTGTEAKTFLDAQRKPASNVDPESRTAA
jgi:cell division protease FtsH